MLFIEKYKQAAGVILKKPIMLWGLSLLSMLLGVIASIVTIPFFIVAFGASVLLECGMVKVYLDGLKGQEVNSKQLFAAFNRNCLRVIGGMAWKQLWIIIWCLIPIVGPFIAIAKAYSYAFVPYILMTKPEVSAIDALKLSMEMTKGKRAQMFLADLCFGAAVAIVCFVLGLLSAIPFIGVLFSIVSFLVTVVVFLFSGIFQGLYQASFYDDSVAAEAPAAPAAE